MVNPYDKAARYAAKVDPSGFLHWLLHEPAGLTFAEWLDTRTIPFPGEQDRTCDTVARLDRVAKRATPVACVVEMQSGRRGNSLERLADYALRVRREARHGRNRRGRFEAIAVLVNLTGRPQASTFRMGVPEVPQSHLEFRVLVWTMAAENAAATLQRIEAGQVTRAVLPWIPLMSGGADESIIAKWSRVARQERNAQRRSDYAALALVFAELSRCRAAWKQALEGWNMKESQQVLEWMNEGRTEGRTEGRVENARDNLLRILELRFPGAVPRTWTKQIRTNDDLDELKRWLDVAVTAPDWDSFRQSVNGAE
jgi:hypothetical protein